MKTLFSLLFIILSLSVQAQTLPASQCPTPNVLISRDYVGLTSETISQRFERQGTELIPTQAEFAGLIKSRIFKVYEDHLCIAKIYSYQQKVCNDVAPDLALGRGNDKYRSLFDLNLTLLKRSEIFSTTVKYGVETNQPARFNTASEIVKHLTRLASTSKIPNSWESFSLMLKKIVEEGFITQAEFDEITTINANINIRQLGFMPLEGIQFNEGKGNGKLAVLFDLNITLVHRAALIRKTIHGVSDKASMELAKSFIDFATVNGIPANWSQFVLMMKDAVTKNALTEVEFLHITQELEMMNRENLGFEINYFVCKMENRVHYYNTIEVEQKKEFSEEVFKNYRLFVKNAPLLKGENEYPEIQFHGIKGMSILPTQTFNSYTVESSLEGEVVIINLMGVRKKVTPPNTLFAKVLHAGKKINVNLQNTGFNPLIGGKVVAEVHFFEKIVLMRDRKLAEKTFELKDGNLTAFSPEVLMTKPSRTAYVQVYLKIEGSPYYNDSFSDYREYKE